MKQISLLTLSMILMISACSDEGKTHEKDNSTPGVVPDIHSFARPDECVTTHLSLELTVDFDQQVIYGTATHTIQHDGPGTFTVDVRGLEIDAVTLDDGSEAIETGRTEEKEHMGYGLQIPIEAKTKLVRIRYKTSPDAAALGWLEPVQTADKKMPFLYTQGEAILTRTWIPLQDSPGIRFTYEATIHTPPGFMAVMSATNPQERSPKGTYHFDMTRPVPAYLIALAVGDLDFAPIGERTGVYAEPSMLERARYELADMEKMLEIAEKLYGPYQWDRYDVIVLPPSFPFGGMENPKLTFATPTIIAGDRSLVSLVAHEMAHSWSGNLVTNATWNDFWLNEGFTVYFENRIMEALYGPEYARMLALLGYQDLEATVADLGEKSADTHLYLDLEGRDPDDGMTSIAYDKGALFLRMLEEKAGRPRFDQFLKGYFEAHKFQSMTTEKFVAYLKEHLLEPEGIDMDIDAWIYGPGIPADHPQIVSDRFIRVDSVIGTFTAGTAAERLDTAGWTTHEWLHFIRHLPKDLSLKQMSDLDKVYGFSGSGNSEIAAAWYELALRNVPGDGKAGYADQIIPQIEYFLFNVGRRKFLMPIYRAMKESGREAEAKRIYQKSRPNYHAVSQQSLDALLGV